MERRLSLGMRRRTRPRSQAANRTLHCLASSLAPTGAPRRRIDEPTRWVSGLKGANARDSQHGAHKTSRTSRKGLRTYIL